MPELPEVETMRRGIAAVAGRRIAGLRRGPSRRLQSIVIAPALEEFRRRVVGQRIASVGRLGKRITLALDGGETIVLEPRMTGIILLEDPPNEEHLRLVFSLEDGGELLFWDQRGLGVARLLSAEALAGEFTPQRLGPDALAIDRAELCGRIGASRRAIKVALMDQRALAGIGNLYASEILHRARIHPARPCAELRPAEWRRIHAAIVEVLAEAVRYEGSTLADGTYRVRRQQPGRYQNEHRVYQRAGQPCRQCGKGQIVRIVQAQRSTFYCPRCQRG